MSQDMFNPVYPNSNSDVWNNLLMFGLQTMAAGGVPGATTLGAVGQGGVAAMEQSRQTQQARAQTNYMYEDMRQKQIQNALSANQLNMLSSFMGTPSPLAPGMTQGVAPPVTDPTKPPANLTGQPWAPTAGQSLPSLPGSGSASSVTGSVAPPTPPMSMMPSGVNQDFIRPSIAMQMMGQPALATAFSNAAVTPYTAAATEWAKVAPGLHMKQNTPERVSQVDNRPTIVDASGATASNPNYGASYDVWTTPAQASGGNTMASPYAQNAAIRAPAPTPPTPNQLASTADGISIDGVPSMDGSAFEGYAAPQSAEQPFGLPTKLNPTMQKFLETGGLGADEDAAYTKNVNALSQLTALHKASKDLAGKGLVSQGAAAESRAAFAKGFNTLQGVLGVSDGNLMFDTAKIAATEDFQKQSEQLSFNLATALGSGAGAQVLTNAQKAVPSLSNTPLGGQLVTNLTAEQAQRNVDAYEYTLQRVGDDGVPAAKARVEFKNKYPGEAYVKRAVSQVKPIEINRPSAFNSLLPGTLVQRRLPDGTLSTEVGIVPKNKDYKFSLPPTAQLGGQSE